jgi:hypothetical protein
MSPWNRNPKLVGWIFIVLGLAGTILCAVPWANVVRARWFVPTPCTIVSCRIERAGGRGSDKVILSYTYAWRDRVLTGARYDYQIAASSLTDAKRQALHALTPGTKTTCWVNPANPQEAVIERGLTLGHAAIILPLGFLLLGCGALRFARAAPAF